MTPREREARSTDSFRKKAVFMAEVLRLMLVRFVGCAALLLSGLAVPFAFAQPAEVEVQPEVPAEVEAAEEAEIEVEAEEAEIEIEGEDSDAAQDLILPDIEIEPPDLPLDEPEPVFEPEEREIVDLDQDPIESSRELLRRAGVGPSHLRFLFDGRPLHVNEQETLHRILFNLPRYTLANLHSWQLEDTTLEEIAADPATYRAGIVRVVGRVQAIHSRQLPVELAERFLFTDYYEVELNSFENGRPLSVFAREIPEAWEPFVDSGEPLNEQASAVAMFLKVGMQAEGEEGEPDKTVLYFAARRIAWHPDRVNEELGVIPDHVLLGSMGMDVGLFPQVTDGAALLAEDRECFYQLLFTVRNATPERIGKQELTPHDFEAWLMQPDEQHGKLITIRGICRQASKVIVDDADIQERFGMSHYYELVVFVSLETDIEFTRDDGESAYFTEYPIVVCVRQLPEGMPIGPNIREPVQVTGVYCKLYGYRTERFTRESRYVQTSPLLVGLKPIWLNEEPARNPWIGPLIGGSFVVLLAGVWLSLWFYGRGDRVFQKEVLSKRRLEPEKSLDDMGIEASGEPDFSNLED